MLPRSNQGEGEMMGVSRSSACGSIVTNTLKSSTYSSKHFLSHILAACWCLTFHINCPSTGLKQFSWETEHLLWVIANIGNI